MPLAKLQFRPGINKEITAYSNEGGFVEDIYNQVDEVLNGQKVCITENRGP